MLHSGEKKTWQRSRLLDRRPSVKDFEKLMSNLFCDVDTIMNLDEFGSYFVKTVGLVFSLIPATSITQTHSDSKKKHGPKRCMETDNSSQSCAEIHGKLQICCPFFNEFCSIPLQKIVTFISF